MAAELSYPTASLAPSAENEMLKGTRPFTGWYVFVSVEVIGIYPHPSIGAGTANLPLQSNGAMGA